jgi:hypothetical protein
MNSVNELVVYFGLSSEGRLYILSLVIVRVFEQLTGD